MAVFELILCIIAAVVLSSFLSRFIPKVSTPLVQIALGALATQMPFFPDVTLDPELFMVLFIAPLLYLEAHEIDKRELLRSVKLSLSLAIGLAIATMVAMANPMARDNDNLTERSSSRLSISCASRYSSGAMNNTMNSSGSSVTSGKNGICVANAPNAICTSGVETLGIKRLRNEDNTTAAIMHRMSSNTANVPPSRVISPPNPDYQGVLMCVFRTLEAWHGMQVWKSRFGWHVRRPPKGRYPSGPWYWMPPDR